VPTYIVVREGIEDVSEEGPDILDTKDQCVEAVSAGDPIRVVNLIKPRSHWRLLQ
jgi:hypothetical protein